MHHIKPDKLIYNMLK